MFIVHISLESSADCTIYTPGAGTLLHTMQDAAYLTAYKKAAS